MSFTKSLQYWLSNFLERLYGQFLFYFLPTDCTIRNDTGIGNYFDPLWPAQQ